MLERIGIECTKEEELGILEMEANTVPYFEVAENLRNYLSGKEGITVN